MSAQNAQDPQHAPASELEAREVAEAAREKKWEKRSFVKELFDGRLSLNLIHPHPEPDPEEQARAEPFLKELEAFCRDHIDGDAIDRDGWVPEEVLDGLRRLGCFGIKIPRKYGGLGLSQVTYNRALSLVSSRCGATGAFLSAHQSIGVPQPLLLFGTDAQKEAYLPRLAKGALSAFALTEPEAGSDPANLATHAEPAPDGSHWILNGEKLWCTNGPRAELMVVMARTPTPEGGKAGRKRPITAFIVETAWEGVEVLHTSHFMGLRGLSNGVIRFKDVKVPAENVLWGEGQGLKLALITLNTGRLSLPAFCTASGKLSHEVSRWWGATRVQWGQPVGRHDAIAQKLGRMAADTFAMDAVVELISAMADAKSFDIRLEAAIAKMWHSETGWRIVNDALQIRGGRGYETVESLAERGELPIGIERAVRDMRINLIFEGSSEVMRLFIAREAVDEHLRVAGDVVDSRAPMGRRVSSALRAGVHYAWWYPSRWAPSPSSYGEFGSLARHLRYVRKTSRRLSRTLFHTMVRFGAGLEKRQAVLGRLVDIGAELFVMTAACVRAARMVKADPGDRSPEELANAFCLQAKHRIEILFGEVFDNADVATYKVARRSMEGAYNWMESWIIPAGTPVGGPAGNGEGAAPLPKRSPAVVDPAPASGAPDGATREEAGTAAD